jgi:hypothetical protein
VGGKRCRADVTWLSAVVLDFDGLTEKQSARLFKTLENLGLAYGAHTTQSHDPEHEQHRYRVVLPLSRPAGPAEYRATVERLVHQLNLPVDRAVFDVAHRWLFPRRGADKWARLAAAHFYQDGKLLEPEVVAAAPVVRSSTGLMPQPTVYTLDSLRQWLKQCRSRQADIQQATIAICDGQPWDDDESGRDSMLHRTLSSIALRARGVTQDLLEELVEPSVEAVRSEGSKIHMGIARKKIQAALAQAQRTPFTSSSQRKTLGPRPRRQRVAWFVSTMLEPTDTATMPGAELQAAYRTWAVGNGGSASTKVFSQVLAELGINQKWVHGKSMWPVRLKERPLAGPGPLLTATM